MMIWGGPPTSHEWDDTDPDAPKPSNPPEGEGSAVQPRGAGRRLDGAPRAVHGTNPPKSPEAAAYGARVAAARKQAGLSQAKLATQIGMSQGAVCNIERGVANAGDGAKRELASFFGDPTLAPVEELEEEQTP